ncbi:hypothetical protein BJ508DRAFT_381373 [Ascobolus immersus RN42]|uniref:DDE-1 domain-containing protein n=1 Tax=Ascobolus immersus RN42 TaxID=1160509 RepID=A0A3N4HKY8_ASCIM|nr:hypothetical protein BJ508DRAFT_381373 [Ascobolus immersus RN42]
MDRYVIHGITRSQLDQQRREWLEEWRETKEEDAEMRMRLKNLREQQRKEALRARVQRYRQRVKQRRLQEEIKAAPVVPWTNRPPSAEHLDPGLHQDTSQSRHGDKEFTEVTKSVEKEKGRMSSSSATYNNKDVWVPPQVLDTSHVCDYSAEGPIYIPDSDEEQAQVDVDIQPTHFTSTATEEAEEEGIYSPLPESAEQDADIMRAKLADATRPWRRLLNGTRPFGRKKKPCGRKKIHAFQQAERFNWFHGLLWEQIHGAMVQSKWKPAVAKQLLMQWNHTTFQYLHHWVISRWMDRVDGVRQPRWSAKTEEKVREGRPLYQNNRAGILDQKPEVKRMIVDQLIAIRKTGCRITVVGVQAIVIAYVNTYAPDLFATGWRVSDAWTRNFLRNTLGWTIRRGTTAAQKLPEDWHRDAIRTCCRMAYLIRVHNIPSCYVLNMDETGVLVQPGGNQTYHETGAHEVPITGAEDKRQFTLLCTIAMSGYLLPFAALWKGTTAQSLPKAVDQFLNLALQQGHRFFLAGEKHWSTVFTMMMWVLDIVLPYRKSIIARCPQYSHTPMILYIDVYWCHRCDEFLDWLETYQETRGCFIVLFVPANTTSVCQPCDVGLQRPVKHELRRQHMRMATMETAEQLRKGISPENIRLDVSLPHLRNQTPQWLYNTYNIVSSTNAVSNAWKRSCKTGIFDLSYETLTSPQIWDYIRQTLPLEDPDFYRVLFQDRSLSTIRPVLDGKKVIVEDLEPGGSFYEEDGTELETGELVYLMNGDTEKVASKSPVGVSQTGSFYYSAPEEDTDYGHVDGAGGVSLGKMNIDFVLD